MCFCSICCICVFVFFLLVSSPLQSHGVQLKIYILITDQRCIKARKPYCPGITLLRGCSSLLPLKDNKYLISYLNRNNANPKIYLSFFYKFQIPVAFNCCWLTLLRGCPSLLPLKDNKYQISNKDNVNTKIYLSLFYKFQISCCF